jgi:antitoxin component of MazEF toxin-antitoxin module
MHLVKLRKDGDSVTFTLPASVMDALCLREEDEMVLEVVEERVILSRASPDVRDAWKAYQEIEPRYGKANRRLAE